MVKFIKSFLERWFQAFEISLYLLRKTFAHYFVQSVIVSIFFAGQVLKPGSPSYQRLVHHFNDDDFAVHRATPSSSSARSQSSDNDSAKHRSHDYQPMAEIDYRRSTISELLSSSDYSSGKSSTHNVTAKYYEQSRNVNFWPETSSAEEISHQDEDSELAKENISNQNQDSKKETRTVSEPPESCHQDRDLDLEMETSNVPKPPECFTRVDNWLKNSNVRPEKTGAVCYPENEAPNNENDDSFKINRSENAKSRLSNFEPQNQGVSPYFSQSKQTTNKMPHRYQTPTVGQTKDVYEVLQHL
jgi:hypothetical protein